MTDSHAPETGPVISSRQLLRVWLSIGTQSFGGGSVTLALIRQAYVEQQQWISDEELTRDMALCNVAPGINLVALAILLGRRVAGIHGILLALVGMLLPSVAITILIAACFRHFHSLRSVQSAIHGVLPATVGIGMLTASGMARSLLAASHREGRLSLLVASGIFVGGGACAALLHVPVVVMLCAGGGIGALHRWAAHSRRYRAPDPPAEQTDSILALQGRDNAGS